MRTFWIIAMITATGVSAQAQTASQTTHTVGRGDSLYGIVAEYYPLRLAQWSDVAADIVALNPDVFPEGLDSVMKLGDQLVMVDYGTPTQAPDSTPQARDPVTPPRPQSTATSDSTNAEDSDDRDINETTEAVGQAAADSAPASDTIAVDQTAQRAIGRVMSSTSGIAISHNNQQRQLDVNDLVYPGDAIITEPYASVTVTMLDEAEYRLQPSSRLLFERYQYNTETDRGTAIMTLVKGGFNARTGQLGKKQTNAVTVNTAVATVRVRGPEFALRVCASDSCRVRDDRYLAAGLYTGVLEGSILVSNNTGDRESRRGEFLHVAAPNTRPETTTEAAGILFSSSELALLDVDTGKEQPLGFFGWLKRKLLGD